MKKVTIRKMWETYDYFIDEKRINPKDIKEIYDKHGNKYNVIPKTKEVPEVDWGRMSIATRIVLTIKHELGEIELDTDSEFYIE